MTCATTSSAPFGPKPVGKTTDSNTDLGEIVREIDELAVFNDEAHHIHDNRLAWFKCIQDIHHRLLQKDLRLAIQVDVTATPRHDNGAIFVQTVSDYPLVEAIAQNVVKHPVLPDAASRAKLAEHKSPIITEKYADYLQLGVEEWRKSYAEHEKLGKKAVLFVMVDDTKNCDEVGAYLEKICPELQDAVLVIHTKTNGEISEAASGKNKEELELLRKQSNEIDTWKSPYKAIVSVLMLKEGWDVRNVTTIVGLRAYAAKSNILPEQTLGRGLRRMYFGSDQRETVSVMGTPAFMEFVESIQNEGVTFERVPMGGAGGRERQDSLVVEVDSEIAGQGHRCARYRAAAPDAAASTGSSRTWTELDPARFGNAKLPVKPFTPEETREIVFKTMLDGEVDHTINLDGSGPADYRSVVAFFARQLLKDLRLVGGYDQLYPKVQDVHARPPVRPCRRSRRSGDPAQPVGAGSRQGALRSLPRRHQRADDPRQRQLAHRGAHPAARHAALPHRAARLPAWPRRRCSTGSSARANADGLELAFAAFLETAPDVQAFGKNYMAVGFKLDYVKADGELSTYTPDFIVRTTDGDGVDRRDQGPRGTRRAAEDGAPATMVR